MLDNPLHVFAVAVLAQELGGSNDDVEAVDAGLNGQLGVAHVTSDVGQDLSLEAKGADLLAVIVGLLGGGGRGELDVVDTEIVEGQGTVGEKQLVA